MSAATASSPVGTYPIVASGATATNYAITFAKGSLTVTAAPPPVEVTPSSVPPPSVLGVRLETKAGSVRRIRVAVSGSLIQAEAASIANYRIVLAGRDGKLGTKDDQTLEPRAASYDPSSGMITLTPRRPFRLKPAAQLRLIASGLHDARGQALDGDHDNQPGGDYLTRLTRSLIAVTRSRFSSRSRT
jgi:hypothetical protein